jgi:hypothetical protein
MSIEHAILGLLQAQDPHWDPEARGDAYAGVTRARTPRETLLWSAVQQHGIAFYESELRWIRGLRQALRAASRSYARAGRSA